jgi:hypothetical protein
VLSAPYSAVYKTLSAMSAHFSLIPYPHVLLGCLPGRKKEDSPLKNQNALPEMASKYSSMQWTTGQKLHGNT